MSDSESFSYSDDEPSGADSSSTSEHRAASPTEPQREPASPVSSPPSKPAASSSGSRRSSRSSSRRSRSGSSRSRSGSRRSRSGSRRSRSSSSRSGSGSSSRSSSSYSSLTPSSLSSSGSPPPSKPSSPLRATAARKGSPSRSKAASPSRSRAASPSRSNPASGSPSRSRSASPRVEVRRGAPLQPTPPADSAAKRPRRTHVRLSAGRYTRLAQPAGFAADSDAARVRHAARVRLLCETESAQRAKEELAELKHWVQRVQGAKTREEGRIAHATHQADCRRQLRDSAAARHVSRSVAKLAEAENTSRAFLMRAAVQARGTAAIRLQESLRAASELQRQRAVLERERAARLLSRVVHQEMQCRVDMDAAERGLRIHVESTALRQLRLRSESATLSKRRAHCVAQREGVFSLPPSTVASARASAAPRVLPPRPPDSASPAASRPTAANTAPAIPPPLRFISEKEERKRELLSLVWYTRLRAIACGTRRSLEHTAACAAAREWERVQLAQREVAAALLAVAEAEASGRQTIAQKEQRLRGASARRLLNSVALCLKMDPALREEVGRRRASRVQHSVELSRQSVRELVGAVGSLQALADAESASRSALANAQIRRRNGLSGRCSSKARSVLESCERCGRRAILSKSAEARTALGHALARARAFDFLATLTLDSLEERRRRVSDGGWLRHRRRLVNMEGIRRSAVERSEPSCRSCLTVPFLAEMDRLRLRQNERRRRRAELRNRVGSPASERSSAATKERRERRAVRRAVRERRVKKKAKPAKRTARLLSPRSVGAALALPEIGTPAGSTRSPAARSTRSPAAGSPAKRPQRGLSPLGRPLKSKGRGQLSPPTGAASRPQSGRTKAATVPLPDDGRSVRDAAAAVRLPQTPPLRLSAAPQSDALTTSRRGIAAAVALPSPLTPTSPQPDVFGGLEHLTVVLRCSPQSQALVALGMATKL